MSGGIKEYERVFKVHFLSATAEVKLRSGRVSAPATTAAPCCLNMSKASSTSTTRQVRGNAGSGSAGGAAGGESAR